MQKYRPDIDGIRAIAVLSVIFFHFNEKILPAGFLGVDIFFVLSGYLITSNIYQQISTSDFSFKDFYNRRIKRLLPSLYVVLFFFSLMGYLFLLPQDIYTLNNSLKKIIIFWANHHFAKGRDYFEPLSNENPFLHTWSLAVEEQFYFVWPVLLFGFVQLKFRLKLITICSILLAIVSFSLASIFILKSNSTLSYYSFPTRYGELLVGAILAITNFKILKNSNTISTFAISIILTLFFVMNNQSHFPGLGALPITLATALLLCTSSSYVHSFLSLKPFVFIGKISYQLYLWHWPFLALARYITGQYTLDNKVLVLISILTIMASYLSWKFIENPIRYSKLNLKKTILYFYAAPTLGILLLIKCSPYFYFKSQHFNNKQFNSYGIDNCHLEINNCVKGDISKPPQVLAIGDSHTAHLNNFYDQLGNAHKYSIYVLSGSSCSPVLDFSHNLTGKNKEQCENIKNYLEQSSEKYQTIILSSAWDYHLGFIEGQKGDPEFTAKLKKTLDYFKRKNIKVIILSQIPRRQQSPRREELLYKRFNYVLSNIDTDTSVIANQELKALSKEYSNVTFIDIHKYFGLFFNRGLFFEDKPVYYDQHHLNSFGSSLLARLILEKDSSFMRE